MEDFVKRVALASGTVGDARWEETLYEWQGPVLARVKARNLVFRRGGATKMAVQCNTGVTVDGVAIWYRVLVDHEDHKELQTLANKIHALLSYTR